MQTQELLNRIIAAFPRRKSELENVLKEMGIEEMQEFYAAGPETFNDIPTFDGLLWKQPSPMLRQRFELYGAIVQGPELWTSCSQISDAINSKEIVMLHKALRENWENSVPSRYHDQDLSVFGYTPGVFDEVVYLGWSGDDIEPIVAEYKSTSVHEFSCLDDYLRWKIERP